MISCMLVVCFSITKMWKLLENVFIAEFNSVNSDLVKSRREHRTYVRRRKALVGIAWDNRTRIVNSMILANNSLWRESIFDRSRLIYFKWLVKERASPLFMTVTLPDSTNSNPDIHSMSFHPFTPSHLLSLVVASGRIEYLVIFAVRT